MEELLPLECYHARTELAVRRMASAGGAAFGAVLGGATGIGIASAVGLGVGFLTGVITAGLTGSFFAAFWGSTMLRMRRADDERAHENDAKLMGESLEDTFRYRMPCSLVRGKDLVPGTLYLDRDRAAFVPVRALSKKVETTYLALAPAPFGIEPWSEAPWRARWVAGGEPRVLRVAGEARVLRLLTPDADRTMERLREVGGSAARSLGSSRR